MIKNIFGSLSGPFKGYSLGVLAALASTLFFIPYKIGIQTVKLPSFLLAVYLIAFILNFIGSRKKSKQQGKILPTLLGSVGFALSSVLGNICIGYSLDGLDPSITTVMVRSQVILVIFLGWLVLKEKLNPFLIPGAIVSLGGLLWMNYQEELILTNDLQFYLWGLLAAGIFGTTQLLLKFIIHRINPIQLNHIRLLMGAVLLSFISGALSGVFEFTLFEWFLAATTAVFGPSLSRIFQMYALRYIPVSQSILFTMLTPVFTLLLSVILLQTFPSTKEITGVSIMMIGILLPVIHSVIKEKRV